MTAWILSVIWSQVNYLRRFIFKPQVSFAGKIISVGNLEAGGTGKSPIVLDLATRLLSEGKKICIVSRGYGSKNEYGTHALDSSKPFLAADFGDEVACYFAKLKNAFYAIGADRAASMELARSQFGEFDFYILDDGLQNLKIKKDFEVILLTSNSPCSSIFREGIFGYQFDALNRPQSIWVWTKGSEEPKFWNQIIGKKFRVSLALDVSSIENVRSKKVILVTGIAKPDVLVAELENLNTSIERAYIFKDHFSYDDGTLSKITNEAKRLALPIVTTQKDFVKWPKLEGVTVIVLNQTLVWKDGALDFL